MDTNQPSLDDLSQRLSLLVDKLDIGKQRDFVKVLEQEMSTTGFWDDRDQAQQKSQQLSQAKTQIGNIDQIVSRLTALRELLMDKDSHLLAEETGREYQYIHKQIDQLETTTYLGGEYDKSPAIISVHAGQGGTEAMDWAQMLQRMYLRFAERRSWLAEVVDILAGDEAGIKSTTMMITGSYAYGYLKGEQGTHRLVRQSPFNADKLRQTSFALVEVLPKIEESDQLPIPETDLEWDFFHASSHGGQNVQKVSTAARLRHKPTGIVVTSQSERYQERNREIALNLLRAKLWEIEQQKREAEKKSLKGEFKIASWGNQIRSYVLHPYKMVKDLRTDYEENNPVAVLDGELDAFIDAELKFFA